VARGSRQTYELFTNRTWHGHEWATELTVYAVARALGLVVRVMSSAGKGTSEQYYGDSSSTILTVMYNAAEGHYLGFRGTPVDIRHAHVESSAMVIDPDMDTVLSVDDVCDSALISSAMVIDADMNTALNVDHVCDSAVVTSSAMVIDSDMTRYINEHM